MKFSDREKMKREAKRTWNGQPKGRVDENEHRRSFRPNAYETGDRKCPVACYKKFVYRRTEEGKSPESPFFLAVQRKPEDRIWFSKRPMGKTNSANSFQAPRKTCHCLRAGNSPTTQ